MDAARRKSNTPLEHRNLGNSPAGQPAAAAAEPAPAARHLTPANLPALQRAVGNAAVARIVADRQHEAMATYLAQRMVTNASISRAAWILAAGTPSPASGHSRQDPANPVVVQRVVTQADITGATNILAQPGTHILVVSDAFSLSPANPAITIKTNMQANLYRGMVEAEYERGQFDPALDVNALKAMVGLNSILVKESVMTNNDAFKSAVIWHEYGHVLYDPKETGRVYLHELQSLRAAAALNAAEVLAVVKGRKAAYQAAVDPSRAALLTYLNANWPGWDA